MQKEQFLNIIKEIFEDGGILSDIFNGTFTYSAREEQIQMSLDFAESLFTEKNTYLEAMTGTGKSLAYLIPAALYSLFVDNAKPFLVATHTLNLQSQLYNKDLPLVKKVMSKVIEKYQDEHRANNKELLFKFLMGKTNYRCDEELNKHANNIPNEIYELIKNIDCIVDCETADEEKMFKQFCTVKNCAYSKCIHYDTCPYFVAKEQLAHIIIVNHAYLAYNVIYNKLGFNMSSYQGVIIDECHEFPNVLIDATKTEANANFIKSVMKQLNHTLENTIKELGTSKKEGAEAAKEKVSGTISENTYLFQTIESTLESNVLFSKLLDIFRLNNSKQISIDSIKGSALYRDSALSIVVNMLIIIRSLQFYPESKNSIYGDIIEFYNRLIKISSLLTYVFLGNKESAYNLIKSYENNIAELTDRHIDRIFDHSLDNADNITWLECTENKQEKTINIINKSLKIDENISSVFTTNTLFTSATFFTHQNADFFRKSLNIFEPLALTYAIANKFPQQNTEVVLENTPEFLLHVNDPIDKIYMSPFDYENNCKLFVVQKDAFSRIPSSKWHEEFSFRTIVESRGGVLILCTSNLKMGEYYNYIKDRIFANKMDDDIILVSQSTHSKKEITTLMTKHANVVVVGVDSFWQGFDIQGQNLRVVIIDKLPFEPFADIYIETRNKKYEAEKKGNNAFKDLSIPRMIIKTKQGIGRALRSIFDTAIVYLLDNENAKGYVLDSAYAKSLFKSISYLTPKKIMLDSDYDTQIKENQHLLIGIKDQNK